MGVVRPGVAGHVATITLDRPGALNAFTGERESRLIDAPARCDADDTVRVVGHLPAPRFHPRPDRIPPS
jgi:enoyl-CoA hydratase/carnithine racemase